jgi:uncharacterized RDD family membrane protein YckC
MSTTVSDSTSGPRAALKVIPPAQRVRQAGFITRSVAFVIDIVTVMIGSVIFAALVSLVLNFFGFSADNFQLDTTAPGVVDILQTVIVIAAAVAVVLFIPAYFVSAWVLIGATPGKLLLGLQVVRTNHTPLGWGRATLRFIGYWISAIVLFLGFLWVLVDRRRQGWHDKLAGTYVVYVWQVPPALDPAAARGQKENESL